MVFINETLQTTDTDESSFKQKANLLSFFMHLTGIFDY